MQKKNKTVILGTVARENYSLKEYKKEKNSKGITLIALVITIIVLLILAGVSIAMLIGENGILTQAEKAKKETNIKGAKEELQLEASGSFDDNGKYNVDRAIKNLKNNLNIEDEKITNNNGLLNVEYKGNEFYIDTKGNVIYDGYIKDGLILRYDGLLNTKSGNDPNAKYWEDLSGNNNDGEIKNSNTSEENLVKYISEENGYRFTYNNNYIMSKKSLGLSTDPNVTFEFVYKWYGFQNGQTSSGLFTIGSGLAQVGKSFSNFINTGISFNTVNFNVRKDKGLPQINKKYNISFVKKAGNFNITNASIYENAVRVSDTSEGNVAMNYEDTKIHIGRAWQYQNENRTLNGIIYAVRIYNKALTDEEIKNNYEVDKLRFGI